MKKAMIFGICMMLFISVITVKAENEFMLTDSNDVRLLGRGESCDDSTRTFNWCNSGFEFIFEGKKAEVLVAQLENSDDTVYNGSFFNVAIYDDDELVRVKRIKLKEGWNIIYEAEEGDPPKKKIMFVRSSEPWRGTASFSRLRTDSIPVATSEKERLIEFIGDSYTAGYANAEYLSQNPEYCAENTDNWVSYTGVLARHYDADFNVLAYSGRGAYANRDINNIDGNMTEQFLYDEVWHPNVNLNMSTKKIHDFLEYQPHIVCIWLGTNDAVAGVPGDVFKVEYKKLVDRVRNCYPDTTIICASIKNSEYHDVIKEVVEGDGYGAENKYHMLSLDEFRYTYDYHPDTKEHERIAKQFISKIDSINNVWDLSRKNSAIRIDLNDNRIVTDIQPVIKDGSLMVPLRVVAEALDYEVLWNEKDSSATLINDEKTIVFHVRESKIEKDNRIINVDVLPEIFLGRTLIPLQAVRDCFDIEVNWDEVSRRLTLKNL